MNRRAFLATVPALTLAGCAARLGLVDRVEVAAKYVHVAERADASEDEYVELARRRFDPGSGPAYDGEIHEFLADDVDPDEPLTISEETTNRLEGSFDVVRYGMRACASIDDESDCRDTWLFRDDFNDLEVGNTVDVRYGDEVSGIVSVHD